MRSSWFYLAVLMCAAAFALSGCSDDATQAGQTQSSKETAARAPSGSPSYTELSAIPVRERTAEQDYLLARELAKMGSTEAAQANGALPLPLDEPRLLKDSQLF